MYKELLKDQILGMSSALIINNVKSLEFFDKIERDFLETDILTFCRILNDIASTFDDSLPLEYFGLDDDDKDEKINILDKENEIMSLAEEVKIEVKEQISACIKSLYNLSEKLTFLSQYVNR